jgi:hypothetical protein
MKQFTVGHPFYISLPDYMIKTVGINSSASIQFKNEVKDVAGFVIEDNKEELKLAEITYSSTTEFYEDFIKDFLTEEDKRTVSKPVSQKKGDISFIECDASYYDKDVKGEVYYFIGIAETKTAFYKVLCYASLADKAKFKGDFQKILYSLRD